MDLTCSSCALAFFTDPLKMSLVLVSFTLAIITFLLLRHSKSISPNKKLALIYSHIFFLVFPFIFYILFRGCATYFTNCNKLKPIIALLLLTGLIAALLGLVIAPFLFIRRNSRNSFEMKDNYLTRFIDNLTDKRPRIFLLNIAKPIAFSTSYFKPKIFISAGLTDLLTRKETEAVLLHELAHINNKSSLLKSSTFFLRIISPLSNFSSIHKEMSKDEIKADEFAIGIQGTEKYIKRAKKRIKEFYNY